MLQDVESVNKMAGALLDDPSNSTYTAAYLRPFVDLQWAGLDTQLQRAGMQYTEGLVSFDVPAGTLDLSALTADGQPLADLKAPKYLWWKLVGQSDSYYAKNRIPNVEELANPLNTVGIAEYRWAQGNIQIDPSVVDVTVKVAYWQESVTVYDPGQNIVRGTGNILAARVAAAVAGVRRGMEKRAETLGKEAAGAWNDFKSILIMQKQGRSVVPPRMHPLRRGYPTPYLPASR